jgi:hypothetical protein
VIQTLPVPGPFPLVLILKKTMYDPANRPDFTDNTTTDMLTERDPLQILGNGFNFTKITNNEQFSGESYLKKVINTDCVQCNMLIYSTKVDVIFCFYCKLYGAQKQVNW